LIEAADSGSTEWRSRARRCFVHVGLHKTGSTAIQRLLSRAGPQLTGRGLFYPSAGRFKEFTGHHNIAWEVTHDRRYDRKLGSIAELLAEIVDVPQDVILSSEDFEGVVGHPDEMCGFVRDLRRVGFDGTAVMYVREQVDVLASLYLTLLTLGLGQPFGAVLDDVLESGRFAWKEWIFNFDYAYLARCLRSCALTVCVRPYPAAARQVCGDFLSMFGLRTSDLGFATEPQENLTGLLAPHVRAYWRNRWGIEIDEAHNRELSNLDLNVVSKAISPEIGRAIRERFADSNRELADEYGVVFAASQLPPSGPETPAVYLDRVFRDVPDLSSTA
jgi:hypothetical protein